MATGFQKNGADIDTIFKAHVLNSTAATGYNPSGAELDLKYVFEAYRAFSTKVADVGFEDGGQDISNVFLDINVPITHGSDDWPYADTTITHSPAAGDPCSAFIYAGVGGTFSITQNGSGSGQVYKWLDITGGSNGENHYVKYTVNSGDSPTYTNLTTSYVKQTGNWWFGWSGVSASYSANITISIAEDASGTNAHSWTADWTLTYTPDTVAIGGDWPESNTTLSSFSLSGATVRAGFNDFASNGEYTLKTGSNGASTVKDWLATVGAGNGDDKYIKRSTYTGDTLITNITTSYQLMSSARYIYLEQFGVGSKSTGTVTITIADDASGTNASAWSGTFACNVTDN